MQYDIIIIGSGPGGYVGAIRASQLGFKVAVIEKENLGGICLNWGCIPTKALLKSAQVYEDIKHAASYGIKVTQAEHDFAAVIKRSRGVAEKMSKGVQFLMKKNKIDVIVGFGKLKASGQVEVQAKDGTTQTLSAPHIILATGARAKELPNIKMDGKKVIGYREALSLPTQPKSMIIMGSGAIGVEFAYFYNSMGVKVTVVEFLPRIVPNEDADVSKELEKIYKRYGIDVLTSAAVESVNTSGAGVVARIKTADGVKELAADILLSAVGITANLEGVGLETLGVKTEKGKVTVTPYYETSAPGIYAIGDILPTPALAHVASKEAIVCVEHIAYLAKKTAHKPEVIDYNNIPGCTYCSPEIASVGYTEEKARAAGYEVKVGKFPYVASGKANASGHTEGFVKVVFDAKYGEWLGAHLIGSNVTEMLTEATITRKLEGTYQEVLDTIHPHPTMSEAVKEAVAVAYGEAIDI